MLTSDPYSSRSRTKHLAWRRTEARRVMMDWGLKGIRLKWTFAKASVDLDVRVSISKHVTLIMTAMASPAIELAPR
jgi:hypothetical protein